MPEPVNLIRPDGSTLRVADQSEADRLRTLGYKEESGADELGRNQEAGREEYYTTPGQHVLTAIEGGISGITLGASDLFINGEGTQRRAQYNPGTRLVSELAGSILPGVGPLEDALKFTPAGALMRGAGAAGEAVGRGSATIKAITTGAVEGAGFGANQAVTEAEMSGDPLTVESVMAGVGWGTIYGGGLSALGSKAAEVFEKRGAKAASEIVGPSEKEITAGAVLDRAKGDATVHSVIADGMKAEHAAIGAVEEGHYTNFSSSVHDAASELNKANRVVNESFANIELRPLKQMASSISNQIIDTGNGPFVRQFTKKFVKELGSAELASKEGRFEDMVGHLNNFKEAMVHIEGELSPEIFKSEKAVGSTDKVIGLAKMRIDAAAKAAEEFTTMTSVGKTLSEFPKSAEEFANMTSKKAERLGAAVDQLGGIRSAELSGVQEAVKTELENFKQGLGVATEGTPGQQVRAIHELLKEARSKRAVDLLKTQKEGELLWQKTKRAEGLLSSAKMDDGARVSEVKAKGGRAPWAPRYLAGSWARNVAGGGAMGSAAYVGGSWLVSRLMGFKGAVLGTISEKANKWIPRLGRGVQKVASRVEPLATRIDGTLEDRKMSRQDLMTARAREISDAAPGVRDTLYKSVQPLAMTAPDLAAAMHAHGVDRFQFLLSKMPKDPGLAYSNLKSLWKPDPVAVEKFARYYEVFHNPVAVVNRALDNGQITLEAAEGLREMNPELFVYMRTRILDRLSDPKIADSTTYADQVHLGLLIDMAVHSTMDSRFIAPQQMMYQERNKPLEMNPRIQPGGGAGRPSGPGPSATSAQRTTEH